MDKEVSILFWMIGTLVVGGIILGAAKVAFPDLTQQVLTYLQGMIPKGV